MQLTEDQQQRIKAEEIYRAEVQRQLKPPAPQTRWAKLIAFLNTSLGLWLMSSVLLAGVTAGYSHLQAYNAARQQRQAKIEQLDSQLGMRLDYSLLLLQRAQSMNSPKPSGDTRNAYLAAVNAFLVDEPETRLSPNFKDRSTLSLVVELYVLDKSQPQSGDHSYKTMMGYIGDLMQARQGLTSDGYNQLNDKDREALLTAIESTMKKIDQQ
jgi:hypothetical protein